MLLTNVFRLTFVKCKPLNQIYTYILQFISLHLHELQKVLHKTYHFLQKLTDRGLKRTGIFLVILQSKLHLKCANDLHLSVP